MKGIAAMRIGTVLAGTLLVVSLTVSNDASAQVGLPPLDGPLTRPLDPALERADRRVGSRLGRRLEEAEEKVEEPAPGETVPQTGEAVGEAVSGAAQTAGNAIGDAAGAAGAVAGNAAAAANGAVGGALRAFGLAADPAGWPVERDIVVTLLPAARVDAAVQQGFELVARRDLPALGLVMVTLRKPATADLGQAIANLRGALPDATIDFNHVYRFADTEALETAPAGGDGMENAAASSASLRIGMIDSAVLPDHPALADSRIASRDFVTNEGRRPLGHGTAVASLIARAAQEAEILSASVFFQTPNYAPGATTESLVAALDWLASERVDVINMSLAGPGNALLEQAVDALLGDGPPIVAAVGNNGPSGEPLYPAAYTEVIGVTAVDRDGKIFLYANRGEHVDYAALGVNVKVADSAGTWRMESGTSMASPRVAVVVARLLQPGGMSLEALTAALTAGAEDLGKRGFDSTFGHGLISDVPTLLSRE